MRKAFVEAKVKLVINMEEGVEVSTVIDEMDYSMVSTTTGADIMDTEILDYNVTDRK